LVVQPTLSSNRAGYIDYMMIIELFLSAGCVSASSALALAQEAVRQVPEARLVVRFEREDRARMKELGVFIYPTFVLDGKPLAIGEPDLESLVAALREKSSKNDRAARGSTGRKK